VIFTTDLHRFRSSVPQPRAVGSGWVEPTPIASWKPPGDKYIEMLHIAELSALIKPDDKK
jgi:hypothetical protein